MISPKTFLRLLPWLILLIIVATLWLTNHWPFSSDSEKQTELVTSTVILQKVENLGRLELTRYNFKEVFEYRRLSSGKIVSNSILRSYDYDPDLSVLLIASGEAVGCLDLTQIELNNIEISGDSVLLTLPPPQLCYHKLDLENTKIYSFSKESWWSKLFSDKEEQNEVLQMAYREAEAKLEQAAIESGIFSKTNENALLILQPLLENLSGKSVFIETTMPEYGFSEISPQSDR